MSPALKQQLQRRFNDRVRFEEPLSAHTSFRIGGPADAFIVVEDEDELAFLMPMLRDHGLPFLVLGGGTNLLVKDGGFRGVVMTMTGQLTLISRPDPLTARAMAGAKLNALCRYAAAEGLSGMNFAVGIPGTVGGAIRMNAGTALGTVAGVLDGIRVMFQDGDIRALDRPLLQFGHRRMTLAASVPGDVSGAVIIEGRFRLSPGSTDILSAEADGLLKARNASQPVRLPSAGCFFKNPETGDPAGRLIDMAGLKGLRVGGAEVSPRHANYIVNTGGATAADVLHLMDAVRERVSQRFNILLEPEVQIVGV